MATDRTDRRRGVGLGLGRGLGGLPEQGLNLMRRLNYPTPKVLIAGLDEAVQGDFERTSCAWCQPALSVLLAPGSTVGKQSQA